MPIDYDESITCIRKLSEWYKQQGSNLDRNEATTRLHLIDTLLFDCLGWDKAACESEQRFDGEYSDYCFSAPHRLLIVEAKREGIYFELPAGLRKLIYDIKFFKKYHPQVYAAIKQAIEYCQARGTPFGAVANGHQLIGFLGSRTDGIPPLEGKSLVFDSLDFMEQEFLKLWQALSKPGIQAHHMAVMLQEGEATPPPEKLSKRLLNYPGFKNRNDLQTDMKILGELVIEDIPKSISEKEFLINCYSKSGALSQYALISRTILQTRYSSLFEQASGGPSLTPLVTKKGVNKDAFALSISRRPILLLGDVGVGKSIFIQHFIQVEAADLVENAMVFYIDFGINPTLVEELRPYIINELERQFLIKHGVDIRNRDFLYRIYNDELKRFEEGIYSDLREIDPPGYVKKRLEYLEQRIANTESHFRAIFDNVAKERRKQIIFFFDNVDQRPYEFQQDVFLIAQSMAESWPKVTVFVSIRPETYYRSRSTGALSAYHPKAFTIFPPRLDNVIQKRLTYAISLMEKGALPGLDNVSVNLVGLKNYLQSIRRSFESNESLMEFIDNICEGNVRLALDYIRAFIGSGHVDTVKILNIFRGTGNYTVPLHEFLRAVIYGDHEYFDPAQSEIVNVFDICSIDGREHFLMSIILVLWKQNSLMNVLSCCSVSAWQEKHNLSNCRMTNLAL